MLINGSESNKDLQSFCDKGKYLDDAIILDRECFIARLKEDCGEKGLCLRDLEISISNALEYSKTLSPGEVFEVKDCLQEYRIALFRVIDNKVIKYRKLDSLGDNFKTVNYDFDIDVHIDDISCSKANVEIDVSLTPDNTQYVATWDNIDTIYINGDPFANWNEADLSWFDVGVTNISNSLQFESITGSITGVLMDDGNGNFPETTITGVVGEGKIKYSIDIKISYDLNTDTLTYSVDNVDLVLGEFETEDVVIKTDSDSVTKDGDVRDISIDGSFKTIFAKRYKSLNGFMLLSSEEGMKLDNIELYNNTNNDVTVCQLLAI